MKTTHLPQNMTLGIDIAKDTFDVVLLRQSDTFAGTFANDPKGYQGLHKWLEKRKCSPKTTSTPLHACMEATGYYGADLADFLHQQGYQVSVVNPARIKAYGQSQMQRNKTDREDAKTIAHFCLTQQPELWTPPTPSQRELQALVRRLETLKDDRQRERNRLETAASFQSVVTTIRDHITFLSQQIDALTQQISDHIKQDPTLKQYFDLLTSIPGIGNTSAALLLAELPEVQQFHSVGQLVAYAGLSPAHHTSGSSVHRPPRLSKKGNIRLRSIFFMPALTAIRYNPVVRALADRLDERGKEKMVIIGAAMRKLLHLVYGVLKTCKPFDPDHCSVNPQATS